MSKRPRLEATAAAAACSSSDASKPRADDDQQRRKRPLVIVIAGPTGVGKSSVAMNLCMPHRSGALLGGTSSSPSSLPPSSLPSSTSSPGAGHIVSADSVQAYRGVRIGANKPSDAERTQCPHHLIDVVGPDDTAYNAADWMRDAIYAVDELTGRRRRGAGIGADDGSADEDEGKDDNDDKDDRRSAMRRVRREGILRGINAARGASAAAAAEMEAREEGTNPPPILPVVVGGTMMYLQWLVHGRPDAMRPTEAALERAAGVVREFQAMDDNDEGGGDFGIGVGKSDQGEKAAEESGGGNAPPPPAATTAPKGQAQLSAAGWDAAVAHAKSLGAPFASRVDKLCGRDWYRLRRILEVAYTVGADPTEEQLNGLYNGQRHGGLGTFGYDVRCFFLCPDDRLKHAEVVDSRCEEMLSRGLFGETADLSLAGQLPDDGQPARAIGYRQTLDYLRRDDARVRDAEAFGAYLDEFTTATRRYAKKQMQWFRKDQDFLFVPVSLSDPPEVRVEAAADVIVRMCLLSREDYDRELLGFTQELCNDKGRRAKKSSGGDDVDRDGGGGSIPLSARTKIANEKQGKGMKFYIGKRYKLIEGTPEHDAVLAEADECTARMQGLSELPS